MITIDFNSFWSDQVDLKDTCVEFVESTVGSANKVVVLKEDNEDPESSFSLFFNYENLQLDDFEFYDDLMDFARENELYVIIYDHTSKMRKGYWYDEDEDWIEQEVGDVQQYMDNV
jgi:hypothetical protein